MLDSRYMNVATSLQRAVGSGTYDRTGRLPHKRQLAEQYGVSVTTVYRAVQVLKDLGVVYTTAHGTYLTSHLKPGPEDFSDVPEVVVARFDDHSGGYRAYGYITFADGMRVGYAPNGRRSNQDGLVECQQTHRHRKKSLTPQHWRVAAGWVRENLQKGAGRGAK